MKNSFKFLLIAYAANLLFKSNFDVGSSKPKNSDAEESEKKTLEKRFEFYLSKKSL